MRRFGNDMGTGRMRDDIRKPGVRNKSGKKVGIRCRRRSEGATGESHDFKHSSNPTDYEGNMSSTAILVWNVGLMAK